MCGGGGCVSGVPAGVCPVTILMEPEDSVYVLGHCSLPYSLEAGSLTGPGAKASQEQATSIPLLPLCMLLELKSCVFMPSSPAGAEP